MNPESIIKLGRAASMILGITSVGFSLLALRYFMQRRPPEQVRLHVARVTWTFVAFVVFEILDTLDHWSSPFRWQLFGHTIVFIMAMNAQAPLVAYERSARKFPQPDDPPAPPAPPPPPGRSVFGTTAVLVIIAVITLGVGVALLPVELRTPAFDPLELSTQIVKNRVDGMPGPALHLGEELSVAAVKCNTSGKDIGIEGRTRWVSIDPGGSVIDGVVGSGIRPAQPRCPVLTYSNKLPDAVVARTQELFNEGRTSVAWTYTGIETPLGLRGVPRSWSTEVFRIVR